MPEHAVIQSDLSEHPAVRAWSKLRPTQIVPEAIEILKNRNDSKVYRLLAVGPGRSNVVAKRCPKANALAERFIYDNVLPQLPLVTLRHYGLLQEQDAEFCWAFMEDAEGVPYSPDIAEHCVLAAEWLATMHTSVLGVAAKLDLPDRGHGAYLGCLRSACDRIRQNLANPALTEDDQAVLYGIVSQCDVLEQRWGQVEECCDGIPWTFVHADLHESNLHVRTSPGGATLLPFDWESAAWAVPAVDLALPGLDLPTYWSVVRKSWSSLEIKALRRLALVGKIFQLLGCIDWESKSLASEWLHRPMKHMRCYEAEIAREIEAAGLEQKGIVFDDFLSGADI